MTTREALHRLVDELPDGEVSEAERLLKALQIDDPVARAMALAPLDDEELTPDEEAALQEGRDALARGDVHTLEAVRRGLNL